LLFIFVFAVSVNMSALLTWFCSCHLSYFAQFKRQRKCS